MLHRNGLYMIIPAMIFAVLVPDSVLATNGTPLSGSFDSFSPQWNRVKATGANNGCDTVSEDSQNDGVRYEEYRIVPKVDLTLEAVVTSSGANIDTMLAVFCQPFDPATPAANLMAMDDDGNGYPNASLNGKNVALTGGESYYLVVSSYSNFNPDSTDPPYGDYQLQLGADITHVHSLKDGIVALRVVAGQQPSSSTLDHLADILDSGRITLATALQVLKQVADNP